MTKTKEDSTQEKALSTRRATMIPILSIPEMKQMAEEVSKSKLFPSAPTPEAAFTLMMLCHAEGLHPMQAVRRFHIIQGRASMKADAILAEFQEHGGKVEWKDYTHDKVTGVFDAPGLSKPLTVTWSMPDAVKANLSTKDNWKNYPRQMLKARVISDGVRMAMPAVMVGMVSAEEAQDMPPVEIVPVEPPRRAAPEVFVETTLVKEEPEKVLNGQELVDELPDAQDDDINVVTATIAAITYKSVDGQKSVYDYYARDSKGVVYHTRNRDFANTIKMAKENGLVIVFGQSDDLMEFHGAIRSE